MIGIVCEEPDPSRIVRRDAVLNAEDHVRIVLGPFADGRSGYVFAVNLSGARYVYGAFTRFAQAARSYSCKSPPRRSRRFSVIGCVPVHVADVRPLGGAKSRLR